MGDHRSSGSRALALGAHSERRDLEEQPLPERVAVRVRWRMRGSIFSHPSVQGLGTRASEVHQMRMRWLVRTVVVDTRFRTARVCLPVEYRSPIYAVSNEASEGMS